MPRIEPPEASLVAVPGATPACLWVMRPLVVTDPIGHNIKFFKSTYQEINTELKRTFPFILNGIKKFKNKH